MKKILILVLLANTVNAQLIVADVINKIKAEVNCDWSSETVDVIKAGSEKTEVKGIATTFMATMEVLQKANAAGLNFVITHEPTFYSHTDQLSIHANDPIQEAKLQFIKDHQMVVWRFHDHIHRNKPDMIYEGVLAKMDWKKYQNADPHTFTIPEMSLEQIVKHFEKSMGAKTIRVVGPKEAKFTKVGMVLGAAGSGAHFRMLANPDCELLIVGETNEWETVPYVQDAITQGKNKALIVLGHADSEEWGMKYFAEWLSKFYPQTKIEFIEAGNPYWH